jgi:hypothetical protein
MIRDTTAELPPLSRAGTSYLLDLHRCVPLTAAIALAQLVTTFLYERLRAALRNEAP